MPNIIWQEGCSACGGACGNKDADNDGEDLNILCIPVSAPSEIANGHTNIDALVFQLEEMQSKRHQLGQWMQAGNLDDLNQTGHILNKGVHLITLKNGSNNNKKCTKSGIWFFRQYYCLLSNVW